MLRDSIETVLESVLNAYQVRVEIISNVRYCGDWYEEEPESPRGQFHLIGDGRCEVTGPTLLQPVVLRAGDFIVFPKGTAHRLAACLDPQRGLGQTAEFTSMLCGELEFVLGARNPIFTALPSYFVVHADEGGVAFRHLATILTSVSTAGGTGHQIMQNKLADCLFTMAVCDYARHADDPKGIFAALADTRIARALSAIHAQPGTDWTIQSLASVAGMSRTAFARTFVEMMGMPSIEYLSQWRVSEAKRMLRDQTKSVAWVAEALGYQSEAAFRRLFKRIEGVGPGKVRAASRASAQ